MEGIPTDDEQLQKQDRCFEPINIGKNVFRYSGKTKIFLIKHGF